MDNSRDHDLRLLHRCFSDKSLPMSKRNAAYRTYQSIQAQVKDRPLVKLRYRLIAAHRASDYEEAEKIEQQIKDYVWRVHRRAS